MKRITLSEEELERVIKLRRETNASWLKIQKITDIPRHIAKREYQQWFAKQSVDELKTARINIAEKDFNQHRHYLCKLADTLTNHLAVPSFPNITKNSKQYLDKLWEKPIIEDELSQDTMITNVDEQLIQRTKRQNKLLFKSLQEHTRSRVDWNVLNQWVQARDQCWINLQSLHAAANTVLTNILNQDVNFLRTIERDSKEHNAFSRLLKGIDWVIWWNIAVTKSIKIRRLLQTSTAGAPTSPVTVVEFNKRPILTFSEQALANKTRDRGNRAISNLCKGREQESVASLADCIKQMAEVVESLERLLDPLVLRPLILNTRCELCPLW